LKDKQLKTPKKSAIKDTAKEKNRILLTLAAGMISEYEKLNNKKTTSKIKG
jgi:hypothetical protein